MSKGLIVLVIVSAIVIIGLVIFEPLKEESNFGSLETNDEVVTLSETKNLEDESKIKDETEKEIEDELNKIIELEDQELSEVIE
jgi:hypothetical protein